MTNEESLTQRCQELRDELRETKAQLGTCVSRLGGHVVINSDDDDRNKKYYEQKQLDGVSLDSES